nr:MAG TPA: hypothetical protein [Caudoviricetes sp.]
MEGFYFSLLSSSFSALTSLTVHHHNKRFFNFTTTFI